MVGPSLWKREGRRDLMIYMKSSLALLFQRRGLAGSEGNRIINV
jgi:hypothetical protein